jgi:ketosteroid isomerase-like protein
MNSPDNSIMQVAEAYRAAVFEKDSAALMRLFAENVRVFDTWGVWSYEGAGPWRRMVEGWLSSLGTERVKVTFDDVRIETGSPLSCLSAIVTYAAVSPEGAELRSLQNRLSWVLRSTGSGWVVIHEHTSAPVGPGDGKAILQRANAAASTPGNA